MTEVRKGRKPSAGPLAISIGENLARDKWDELSATHLGTIAHMLTRGVAVLEIQAEESFRGRGFDERLEGKMMHLLRELLEHGAKPSV